MTEGTNTDPLDKDERAELLRLRDEVATLRTQTAGAANAVPTAPVSHRPRHGLRWVTLTILLVLVAVLSIAAVTAQPDSRHRPLREHGGTPG